MHYLHVSLECSVACIFERKVIKWRNVIVSCSSTASLIKTDWACNAEACSGKKRQRALRTNQGNAAVSALAHCKTVIAQYRIRNSRRMRLGLASTQERNVNQRHLAWRWVCAWIRDLKGSNCVYLSDASHPPCSGNYVRKDNSAYTLHHD